jgi:hypothetical protein
MRTVARNQALVLTRYQQNYKNLHKHFQVPADAIKTKFKNHLILQKQLLPPKQMTLPHSSVDRYMCQYRTSLRTRTPTPIFAGLLTQCRSSSIDTPAPGNLSLIIGSTNAAHASRGCIVLWLMMTGPLYRHIKHTNRDIVYLRKNVVTKLHTCNV